MAITRSQNGISKPTSRVRENPSEKKKAPKKKKAANDKATGVARNASRGKIASKSSSSSSATKSTSTKKASSSKAQDEQVKENENVTEAGNNLSVDGTQGNDNNRESRGSPAGSASPTDPQKSGPKSKPTTAEPKAKAKQTRDPIETQTTSGASVTLQDDEEPSLLTAQPRQSEDGDNSEDVGKSRSPAITPEAPTLGSEPEDTKGKKREAEVKHAGQKANSTNTRENARLIADHAKSSRSKINTEIDEDEHTGVKRGVADPTSSGGEANDSNLSPPHDGTRTSKRNAIKFSAQQDESPKKRSRPPSGSRDSPSAFQDENEKRMRKDRKEGPDDREQDSARDTTAKSPNTHGTHEKKTVHADYPEDRKKQRQAKDPGSHSADSQVGKDHWRDPLGEDVLLETSDLAAGPIRRLGPRKGRGRVADESAPHITPLEEGENIDEELTHVPHGFEQRYRNSLVGPEQWVKDANTPSSVPSNIKNQRSAVWTQYHQEVPDDLKSWPVAQTDIVRGEGSSKTPVDAHATRAYGRTEADERKKTRFSHRQEVRRARDEAAKHLREIARIAKRKRVSFQEPLISPPTRYEPRRRSYPKAIIPPPYSAFRSDKKEREAITPTPEELRAAPTLPSPPFPHHYHPESILPTPQSGFGSSARKRKADAPTLAELRAAPPLPGPPYPKCRRPSDDEPFTPSPKTRARQKSQDEWSDAIDEAVGQGISPQSASSPSPKTLQRIANEMITTRNKVNAEEKAGRPLDWNDHKAPPGHRKNNKRRGKGKTEEQKFKDIAATAETEEDGERMTRSTRQTRHTQKAAEAIAAAQNAKRDRDAIAAVHAAHATVTDAADEADIETKRTTKVSKGRGKLEISETETRKSPHRVLNMSKERAKGTSERTSQTSSPGSEKRATHRVKETTKKKTRRKTTSKKGKEKESFPNGERDEDEEALVKESEGVDTRQPGDSVSRDTRSQDNAPVAVRVEDQQGAEEQQPESTVSGTGSGRRSSHPSSVGNRTWWPVWSWRDGMV